MSFCTVHLCILEWQSSVLILHFQIGAALSRTHVKQIQSGCFIPVSKCASFSVKYSSEKSFIFFCHLEIWVSIELKFLNTCFAVYKWSENYKEGLVTLSNSNDISYTCINLLTFGFYEMAYTRSNSLCNGIVQTCWQCTVWFEVLYSSSYLIFEWEA
jgi:hypothetical protein